MGIFKSWPFFAAFEKLIELRCLIPKDMISSHIELLPYLSLEGKGVGGGGRGGRKERKEVEGREGKEEAFVLLIQGSQGQEVFIFQNPGLRSSLSS